MLARIHTAIFSEVPQNPQSHSYMMTNILNGALKHWRRVKRGIPDRYRIFFKFGSADKNIIYAWMNDETCLRKDGDKRDVYQVFKKLVDSGKIPDDYCELLKAATDPKG